MPKKSKALAKVKETGGDLSLPSHIKQGLARGGEKLKASDVSMPYLKLSQSTTQQVKQKKMELGVFYNSSTGQVYGPSVKIAVIMATTGQKHWGNFDAGEGILCQSPDGLKALAPNGKDDKGRPTDDCTRCALSKWTEDKKGNSVSPECGQEGVYLVLVPGEEVPQFLSLTSTSFSTAKRINTILRSTGQDTFATLIELTTEHKDFGKMSAEVVKAGSAGWADKKTYEHAEKIYESSKASFFKSVTSDAAGAASDTRGM